jgi:hypothetical protein
MQRLLLAGACLLYSCAKSERVTMLERGDFDQIIVEPFRRLWPEYSSRYRAVAMPTSMRRHFSDDMRLTPSQARLRWMVPILYPSYVDDEHVFVKTSTGWHALDGLDEAMLDRLRALDPTCAGYVEHATVAGPCIEIAWVVADAGLRGQTERFTHACQLARSQCMR